MLYSKPASSRSRKCCTLRTSTPIGIMLATRSLSPFRSSSRLTAYRAPPSTAVSRIRSSSGSRQSCSSPETRGPVRGLTRAVGDWGRPPRGMKRWWGGLVGRSVVGMPTKMLGHAAERGSRQLPMTLRQTPRAWNESPPIIILKIVEAILIYQSSWLFAVIAFSNFCL